MYLFCSENMDLPLPKTFALFSFNCIFFVSIKHFIWKMIRDCRGVLHLLQRLFSHCSVPPSQGTELVFIFIFFKQSMNVNCLWIKTALFICTTSSRHWHSMLTGIWKWKNFFLFSVFKGESWCNMEVRVWWCVTQVAVLFIWLFSLLF